MSNIMDTQLHPGERLVTLPNGNLALHMRNGNVSEYTPEEWAEYIADFHMSTVELIDSLLAGVSGRNMVQTSELIDALLDIRKSAVGTETGLRHALDMWQAAIGPCDDEGGE
jgi:hypothetical protein